MKFSEIQYSRVDLDEAVREGQELTRRAMQAQSGQEQIRIHQEFNRLCGHVRTQKLIASIRRDGDMTNSFYEEENEYYDQELPGFQAVQTGYQRAIRKAPFRDELEKEIGSVPFASMELAAKAFDEKLIPLLQEENKLITRYSKLIASAAIEWEGEILNLSLLGKYMKSPIRQVRRAAWEKYSEFFETHAEELDDIYDRLVKNRTLQANTMGYKNYVELGYYCRNRNSYGREQVENLRQQIKKEYVPFAERMHEKRRQRLGVDHLYYYDEGVYFREGNPAPFGTPEEILAAGEKMYTELSPQTEGFFRMMREMELFDVLGRKNKKAGGYMEELPDYKVPFIYANFNGTSGDLDVITHECGHAFQYYVAAEDPVMDHYTWLGMETAEIHSMSMEFFTEPWMELFFGERGGDYRKMHLEDTIAFIPYGCMVDEFQHIVYENPELTPQQRREAWKNLEREYRPHMDPSGCALLGNGGFWQKQLHIFEIPFYYIDYVIAQLCTFQYKIWMDRDYKKAWESYLKLCRLSGSRFYPELMEEAGLKVPFEDGCIKEIVKELEKKTGLG